MSLFSTPARKHTTYYDHLLARTTTAKERQAERKAAGSVRNDTRSGDGRSLDRSKELNKTYVVSALSASSGTARLTLQRRNTRGERSVNENAQDSQNSTTTTTTPAPGSRLTLQRRTRTGSMDRGASSQAARGQPTKVLSESNGQPPGSAGVFRSASLRDTAPRSKPKEVFGPTPTTNPTARAADAPGRAVPSSSSAGRPFKTEDRSTTFSTPTKKTPFEKIAAKKHVFEKLSAAGDGKPQPVAAPRGQKTSTATTGVARSNPAPAPAPGQTETSTQVKKASPAPEALALEQQEVLKMENSAVTVAVRLRPFSTREKSEKAAQVVFMHDQKTVVQHPDSKQSYSFTYDFSFCSVDQTEPNFVSQQMVYQSLARPLLERAFEGFNTCLFAYGQTGSGKSYTMMGFGEEAGVIPRFCQELFSRLSAVESNKVSCHLELSFFEVYNEKIHDLLVARDDQNHKGIPLRVREHPVHGPYVAELSANVVSSYSDIQGWLELGNKQRATAATGMNEKSSRSHSVFTLVMTQTKTEFVEGEEHDHRITSRINLVDLAGSERCNSAQTSGDRLREGASINKSLLTLGKVISALAEQTLNRKRVFIPYRESVLTWLLKESLGGNSKTAMIATLSPAGTTVEESLSTLRYAQQARTIINLAKVNEDTNAKLIRELKAEVEKLRAAQMSSQGVEPQRVQLFQQEIAGLKSKLSQQEREMAEAQRAWREKLEQAEIRKREETKELQRAGVTFKVDNRLPNLVNLNEDPQLSEMLLYMIKEGRTLVGQLKSDSAHDIQLTGALIADQHCIISNASGTVSITPMENAKTFVNGNLISKSTILHHGDRVILGGDHYFRFNHPTEVQSGKRVSCWTGSGDGQKDFEFAKNELLSAQRAKLEAEIEEAHVKAKEEMMQGIQMAKEVAQKELSQQRALYEDRIQTLERELEDESERKRLQERQQERVASRMAELQVAKQELEHEVDSQKKRLRLHMEAQVMEEHRVRQAKIVEALEAEKLKLSKDLEDMQKKRALREIRTPKSVAPKWDTMKLSLMIEEANKIGSKLKKNTVFSRHESSDHENLEHPDGIQVRVQNTKLGISTFWSLDKFQDNMAAMRELTQGEAASKDDDVFYDPNDEWEQDLSASSSTTSFSRRRSRSLLKSRRISGRLYEIRVHPIQSLHSGPSQSGLMGMATPRSTHPSSSNSALPGICKDLISHTMARLRTWGGAEDSMADGLVLDLHLVYTAVQTISGLYDGLDDDNTENVFVCNPEAQTQLIKATAAVERAVFITLQWMSSARPSSGRLYSSAEELRGQVKRMGGFLQLLIQGCESEISSMVTEARRKSAQCLEAALRALSHMAALTGMPLNTSEPGAPAAGKSSMSTCLLEGTNKGVASLLEEGLAITKEMLRDAQLAYPRTPALQSLKSKTLDLACALQSYIHCHMTREASPNEEEEEDGEEAEVSKLQRLRSTVAKLFQLNQAVRKLHSSLSGALRGKGHDSELSTHRESIVSFAKSVEDLINGLPKEVADSASSSLSLPCLQSVMAARDELHVALRALSTAFDHQREVESGRSNRSASSREEGALAKESDQAQSSYGNRTAPKMVDSFRLGALSNGSPRWV